MKKTFWVFFLLLSFSVTLPVSWWVLSKADFFYASLYDPIGIDSHIKTYAPKNLKNKKGFEVTSKQTRVELFHGIVESIHIKGEGLKQLSYQNQQNQKVILLTDVEVIHLQDVANLLEKLKPVAFSVMTLWIILLVVMFIRRVKIPSTKQLSLSTLLIIFIAAMVLSLGPEKVFNQLHIWVFPDNHQWFFYYEESLMSTMMKAPDLFGYIAAMWVLLSFILTVLLFTVMKLVVKP